MKNQVKYIIRIVLVMLLTTRIVYSASDEGYWKLIAEFDKSTISSFQSVECSDSNNCIAIGNKSREIYAYYTEDGGKSWNRGKMDDSEYNSIYYSLGLSFSNKQFALVFADSGYVYISKDKGKNWKQQQIPVLGPIISVSFYDARFGIIAAGKQIVITRDGGDTWETLVDRYISNFSHGLNKVSFSDGLNGVAMGFNSNFWTTSDRGETWNEVKNLTNYVKTGFREIAYLNSTSYIAVTLPYMMIYRWYPDSLSDVEDTQQEPQTYDFINLYPNPVKNELTLKSDIPLIEYEITDLLGNRISMQNDLLMYGNTPDIKINTEAYASGIYFIKMKTMNGIEYRKFVKE